jgi:hypothetical protein
MINIPRLGDYDEPRANTLKARTIGAACLVALGVLAWGAFPLVAQEPPGLASADAVAEQPEPAPNVRASASPTPGDAGEQSPPALRLREGTQLTNRMGHFKQNGESITFIDDEGRQLGGLPNLNLERITRMLKSVEEPEAVSWSVSGAVTEFAGRNYLLVSRAVYKAATLPPAPDRLGE